MRAVNLLPREYQNAKSIRHEDPAVVIGSALGVIVMIALGGAFMAAHGKSNAQQARLSKARLELAQLAVHQRPTPKPAAPTAPITPIVPPPAVTGQEATWLSAVSTNLSQRIAWDRVLREVSLVVPSDVTLLSLTMTAPVAAVVGGAPRGAPARHRHCRAWDPAAGRPGTVSQARRSAPLRLPGRSRRSTSVPGAGHGASR